MLKSECLNPKDVLSHLNALGYTDITPQQLKEFLHDLKKLIKYEQKLISQDCVDCGRSSNSHSCNCDCSLTESDASSFKLSNNESCDSSFISDSSSSDSLKRHRQLKSDEINKHKIRHRVDIDEAEKSHSSFIRPWNLQGSKELSSRSKRNHDPVSLYHQYKRFWNRQNIPGESKHSELRWVIRNKMMGQEPNPRVII